MSAAASGVTHTAPHPSGPLVSVIMPVHNGAATLGRAIASVQRQVFTDWELLSVDDASPDGSYAALAAWSERDKRIRVFRTPAHQGPGAARNLALRNARGDFVAYLDCDDEFYPGYLREIARFRSRGDVLVFQHDQETPSGSIWTWDPAEHRDQLFMFNLSVPLGVAHRRELLALAGMFDERVWFQEDWDLWKRLARTGAKFLFLPFKSGLYHFVKTSLSEVPRLTDYQRDQLARSRERHDAIFLGGGPPDPRKPISRVLFAAPNSIIDPSSGAAVATNDALQLLASSGFRCQAFGSAMLDFNEEVCVEQTLAELGLPYETRRMTVGTERAKILFARRQHVPVTLFRNLTTQFGPAPEEATAFLTAYEMHLQRNRPDVLLTFGGDYRAAMICALARRRDIPVVFGLHNLAYYDAWTFRHADYVIVPSEFSRQHYWEQLGLHCQVLPNVIDPGRVRPGEHKPQYLTFVNPQPAKGLYVFARIAEQIARRRPDIPMLVVESRARATAVHKAGADLSGARNLFGMANTPDPRKFYRVTKVLIMPSLVNESFGLAAAEAMTNGIPVLASTRGALPEVVGDGGILLGIPGRYTPQTTETPRAEEVEAWVDAIIRLWDDEGFYRQQSRKALERSRIWSPGHLRPRYADFFRNVHPQPGPPIVLKGPDPAA